MISLWWDFPPLSNPHLIPAAAGMIIFLTQRRKDAKEEPE
jgi:hypothetical protein